MEVYRIFYQNVHILFYLSALSSPRPRLCEVASMEPRSTQQIIAEKAFNSQAKKYGICCVSKYLDMTGCCFSVLLLVYVLWNRFWWKLWFSSLCLSVGILLKKCKSGTCPWNHMTTDCSSEALIAKKALVWCQKFALRKVYLNWLADASLHWY